MSRGPRALSWMSLVWMTAEGALGLVAGVAAGSLSMVGWALSSVIEGPPSAIVIWRVDPTLIGYGSWLVHLR